MERSVTQQKFDNVGLRFAPPNLLGIAISGKREIKKAQAKVLGDFFHVDVGLFI